MFINEKSKEINCKVVYFGAPRAGKSTTLSRLCELLQRGAKDQLISLSVDQEHSLYFDFMPLTFGKIKDYTVRLHLYTVPGETAYEKNRRIISKGVDGVVFVVDCALDRMEANLSSLRELKRLIRDFDVEFDRFPIAFQYNKRDLPDAVSVSALREVINPAKRPDFECVATQGEGILDVLKSISSQIFSQLKKESADMTALEST